jgi:hypothetical protein
LNLDHRVMAAARAKASSEGVSLGRAVSDLALSGLEGARRRPQLPVLFPALPGHVMTDELIAEHGDDQ